MKSNLIQQSGITCGIDLGDKKHAICVLDRDGRIIDDRGVINFFRLFFAAVDGVSVVGKVSGCAGDCALWILRPL